MITLSGKKTKRVTVVCYSMTINIRTHLIGSNTQKTVIDGEALYSQQKQDWKQTVAQVINSLLANSDLK